MVAICDISEYRSCIKAFKVCVLRSCYVGNIQSSSVLKNLQLNCIVLIYYVITFFIALRKTGWRSGLFKAHCGVRTNNYARGREHCRVKRGSTPPPPGSERGKWGPSLPRYSSLLFLSPVRHVSFAPHKLNTRNRLVLQW